MDILIFGDSTTQGYHDTERGGWANRLHIDAMRRAVTSDWGEDHSVFALGISGDRIVRLDSRFETEFSRRRGAVGDTLTIFAYGINDSMSDQEGKHRTSLEEFTTLYVQFIERAKAAGSVMLIGLAPIDESVLNPIPWASEYSYLEANRALFDQAVAELGEAHGCAYLSMEGVWGDDVKGHTTDGIHPNAEGHRLMYERVRDRLVQEKWLA